MQDDNDTIHELRRNHESFRISFDQKVCVHDGDYYPCDTLRVLDIYDEEKRQENRLLEDAVRKQEDLEEEVYSLQDEINSLETNNEDLYDHISELEDTVAKLEEVLREVEVEEGKDRV